MELTIVQVFLIGAVASVITEALKWLAAKANVNVSSIGQMVILIVVSVGCAVVFALQQGVPTLEAEVIFAFASGVLGLAVIIYKLLLEKVVFPALSK